MSQQEKTNPEDVLLSAYGYLRKLMEAVDQWIEDLRNHKSNNLTQMGDAIEGITWVAQCIGGTKELHHFEVDQNLLKESIDTLHEGLENQDYPFVSEVLEYEFMPLLSEWYDVIEETLETILPDE